MKISTENPLIGEPPERIYLRNSPLIKVIVQVRFPTIASIKKSEFIAGFQEDIRGSFPILRTEQTHGFTVDHQGNLLAQRDSFIHHFIDKLDWEWKVSLAENFVAIETKKYKNRDDLLMRLKPILDALATQIKPGAIDRIGVRYIDLVKSPEINRLPDLLRPEVAGLSTLPFFSAVQHGLTQHVFPLPKEKATLTTRWGILPIETTIEDLFVKEKSWILDLDVFSNPERDWDRDLIIQHVESFAKRISCFFRWAVNETFLEIYGKE